MVDPRPTGPAATHELVPLFPLPGVVLFPGAALPLHIFEARYRTMVADALAGDRTIAMALLRPGWERQYYDRPAIEPVVCIGKVAEHQRLPDGRYNLLLRGQSRAIVRGEHPLDELRPYRLAEVQPLDSEPVMEIDLCNDRERLASFFGESASNCISTGRCFLQMLRGSTGTAAIADLIAFSLIEDVGIKQKLLSEPDPRRRVKKVLAVLESMRPSMLDSGAPANQL